MIKFVRLNTYLNKDSDYSKCYIPAQLKHSEHLTVAGTLCVIRS